MNSVTIAILVAFAVMLASAAPAHEINENDFNGLLVILFDHTHILNTHCFNFFAVV